MATFTRKDFKVRAGSHLPLLIELIKKSEGPILELGTGFYSTPILHWLCADMGRKLVSYESSKDYFAIARNYITDFHEVNFVEDWSKIDLSGHWGLAFVDHYPANQRIKEIVRLVDNVDYIVAHDSEPRHDSGYQYSKVAPLFKYRYDYDKFYPHTLILSNHKDLSNLT